MGGVEVQLHAFLTSALNGDEWLLSYSEISTSEKRGSPVTI
jgi:hypothetical protein